MGWPRLRLGIPIQLLLVSSFVLVLPWLGLELVQEQQRLLLDVQEQALAATARRAAVALSDRPSLLLASDAGAGPGGVLRILDLPGPVVPDARAEEWDRTSLEAHRLPDPEHDPESPHPLSAVYRIGRQGGGVYVLFEVNDPEVVLRDPESGSDDADRLEIAAVTADDEFLRFAIDVAVDGPVSAWLLREDGRRAPDNRISGAWRTTDEGYVVELRLPRTLVGTRLAFAVVDVDSLETREIAGRLESSGMETPRGLAVVLAPSPEMGDLLGSLAGPRTQLWVIDTGKHALIHAGSMAPDLAGRGPGDSGGAGWLLDRLTRLVRAVVRAPRAEEATADAHAVDRALAGEPATHRRTAAGSSTVVLSAAYPVRVEGRVRAAVLARETATDVLRVRGRAFEKILGGILGVALLGLVALLAFATRLSVRVRRLRDGVEHLEGGAREPAGVLPEATAADEVGDLARAVGAMAGRQREQTAYLEQVGRRLSHEMRTPVGVVRSSLDNLRLRHPARGRPGLPRPRRRGPETPQLHPPADERGDPARADPGRRRARGLRPRPGRARQRRGLPHLEPRAHHRAARDGRTPARWSGSPDLLAQMLDKLVENALGFAPPDSMVEVDLWRHGRAVALSVRNEGPRLPSEMRGRLFESMVSVRPSGASGAHGTPHLGLGLYIVRLIAEFHGGAAARPRPPGRTGRDRDRDHPPGPRRGMELRGHNTQLRLKPSLFCGRTAPRGRRAFPWRLGPDFRRRRRRPTVASSLSRKLPSPRGRPVLSWRRISSAESGERSTDRNRRQSPNRSSSALGSTRPSVRHARCARTLL